MFNVRLQIMPQNVCTIEIRTIKYVPVLEAMLSVVPGALQVQVYIEIYVQFSHA